MPCIMQAVKNMHIHQFTVKTKQTQDTGIYKHFHKTTLHNFYHIAFYHKIYQKIIHKRGGYETPN